MPPLVYAMLGSSKDLAVGTVAVASLLISSMLGKEVNPNENARLYVQLALTATFFAGVFQAALGLLRSVFFFFLTQHACDQSKTALSTPSVLGFCLIAPMFRNISMLLNLTYIASDSCTVFLYVMFSNYYYFNLTVI